MEKNKTGKPAMPVGRYLKYALGEIVLVVVGILIALQINNWNEYRNDISKSRAILGEFKKDLASDTTGINRVVRLLERRTSYEAWALNEVVYDKSQVDSLKKAFFSPVHQEFIKDRTYKKLQVSQNPNLTGFLDLQNDLTTYYTDTKFLLDYFNQEEEEFLKQYKVNILLRKELEMQLDPFPTLSSEDKQIETLISYAQTIEGRNFLKENYSRRSGMIRYFNRVKDEAQELIQKINTHLATEK
jgi:phenylalanine-4-hydroxylase